MCVMCRVFAVCALAMLLPGMAYAQASIAGVVRDASGAVVPGVTVEAASPALIEKVRTAVTDGSGQFRIIELRPGTYTVTFTLTGFNTVRREGIELQGTFAATVNAEMRVGALEETITVTGAAPVVDVQSATRQQVLDNNIVRDLPTSRQFFGLVTLIPGMTVSQRDVGGTNLTQAGNYAIHGGRNGDGRVSIDGITVGQRGSGNTDGGGTNMTMYSLSAGLAQETAITTSGGLGEAETGGVAVNMVPREGGNTIRGSLFGTFGNNAMQADNYDDHLRELGLRSANEVKTISEVSGLLGGPIKRDRLWFVVSSKYQATRTWIANMFANKNAGDPTKWTYEPDFDNPAFNDDTIRSLALRLTFQASPRNKINVFWDEQWRGTDIEGGGGVTTSPEAQHRMYSWPSRAFNATWSNPLTNRLLLEGGYGGTFLQWAGKREPDYPVFDMIRVNEQAGIIPGLNYRNMTWNSNQLFPTQLRGSMSYVTGSHSFKVGGTHTWNLYDDRSNNPNPIAYRFNNGVPNQLTLTDSPRYRLFNIYTAGIFAQDSWTLNRLTLQGGIRYDTSHSFFPEQMVGFTRYNPNGFAIPFTEGSAVKDISPRMAVSYDLQGDGRTALKVTLGKYMGATELGILGEALNPTLRLSTSTTRAWNDADRDFTPDCNLLDRAANGECGPYSDQNFGRNVYSSTIDPTLQGWNVRPYNWEFSASVQRELIPRVGLNVGAFRRWYGNFFVTDNRATAPSDYGSYSVTAPSDPRLPGGGGYVINGLYNVSPAKFGQTDNFVTSVSKTYDGGQKEFWTGYDVTLIARSVGGVTLSGGLSTGRLTNDTCELKQQIPELGGSNTQPGEADPWCLRQEKFQTQYKFLGSYVVPRVDVLVSGTFQSALGPVLNANFNVPAAQIAQSLGRPPSGGVANVQVNLVEPGTLFGERINQFDVRFAKVLTFRGARLNVGLDIFNALNSNTATTYNQTYGAAWLRPTAVLPARFAKLSAQIDF
jgi:hypothetical protein